MFSWIRIERETREEVVGDHLRVMEILDRQRDRLIRSIAKNSGRLLQDLEDLDRIGRLSMEEMIAPLEARNSLVVGRHRIRLPW